jgi:hypothetical protein
MDPVARHALSPAEGQRLLIAEQEKRALFAVRDPDGQLHLFDAPGTDQAMTIGRRAENDVAIPWDGRVSGAHAVLQNIGGELAIVDDGLSTNGTFVNGHRVRGRQRLRGGDRILIGQTVLAYRAAAAVADATIAALDMTDVLRLTDSQRRVLVALCRPMRAGGTFSAPATNQDIAEEVSLSVDGVKVNLRALFTKFEVGDLPQNQKRLRLAERALQLGVVTDRDLG